MKIRIMALPAEARKAVQALTKADGLDVIDVSSPHPNRNSRLVRVYIEAQLRQPAPARHAPAERKNRNEPAIRCSFPGEPAAS